MLITTSSGVKTLRIQRQQRFPSLQWLDASLWQIGSLLMNRKKDLWDVMVSDLASCARKASYMIVSFLRRRKRLWIQLKRKLQLWELSWIEFKSLISKSTSLHRTYRVICMNLTILRMKEKCLKEIWSQIWPNTQELNRKGSLYWSYQTLITGFVL